MAELPARTSWLTASFFAPYKAQWKKLLLIGIAFLAAMLLSEKFIPHPATLFPAVGISMSALFFVGIEFWPVIYVAALIGSILSGFPLLYIVAIPLAQMLQAVAGAYLLRRTRIDPLFRRTRDMLLLIGIILVVAFITPTISSLLYSFATSSTTAIAPWNVRYAANVLFLLVLTPFFMRWFTKPRFSRTSAEIIETLGVLGILIFLNVVLFIKGIASFGGISLVYFLLMPLFWIALRLRPRFVTLALLITTTFAVLSLFIGVEVPSPSLFTAQLFQTEEFLIVIAIIFLIIVSVEEDRRLNANLLRSQVATLENAVARVLTESKAKNDFIAALAHELRNPLAPVVSGIDYLKIKYENVPEDAELMTMMEERMETIRRLLDDLLDTSRIGEGKIILKKEAVELKSVLDHAILSTSHHLRERHQSLTIHPFSPRIFLFGDAVRLEQIFSNLITNASNYSPSGTIIQIRVKTHDSLVSISVQDEGRGITADNLDTIFKPFYQTDITQESKKGLGIGLALVRGFVEMHDGSVTATSKGLGKGSTFTVVLPLLTTEGKEMASLDETDTITPMTTETKKGPCILVVDDNEAAASGMGRLLELKGYSVSFAHDGEQAISQAASVKPEVILLDIGLPDQDGYTVAKIIRTQGYTGTLIALTGYSTTDARAKGESAGFDHYLIKPIGFNELKQVLPELE